MSTGARERVIGLLGSGVSQTIAAEAAGVSESWVSQLLSEPGVAEQVAAKRSEKLEEYIETDSTIEKGEKLALAQVIKKLESPYGMKLSDSLKAFQVLNTARKKSEEGKNLQEQQASMSVTLVLPRAARVMLTVNSENQVIDVEGRSIAPLPSRVLPQLAKELSMQRATGQLAQPGTTRQIAAVEQIPQHVVDLKEKVARRDEARALSIMQDIEMTINGVTVVI